MAPFLKRVLPIAAVLAIVAADFLFTGVWTIRENEQGVVRRFGAVSRRIGPGIQFTLPYPFETVDKVNTRKMPVGFRLIAGRDPTPSGPAEAEWLTGDTNVIDINMMIHYAIRDPVDYLYRVGRGEAEFLVRKCTEAMLTQIIATMQVDDVFTTGKIRIQEETRRGAQALLDRIGTGIIVLSANLQEIAPPADVIAAFIDVSSAKADKERTIQEADGYIKDRLPRARAWANKALQEARIYADTVLAEAHGRAGRFTALCEEYKSAKDITRTRLYFETIEKVLARAEKIIVTTDDEGNARVRIVR